MSDLQQVIKVLASSRKRKQDEEQFSAYEDLQTQREAINRRWKIILGDVIKVEAPTAITSEEKLELENKNQEFIDSINVTLSALKAKDDVWWKNDGSSVFKPEKLGDVMQVKDKLVFCINGQHKTLSFIGRQQLSEATMLPFVVGDLSPEDTLQAYRDFFRVASSKTLFAEC